MDLKNQQMEVMHSMCENELNILQKNFKKFLQESERTQNILKDVIFKGSEILGLISFDRYMTQLVTILNMARKFNIHLQLNGLEQAVVSDSLRIDCLTESRIRNNFIGMNNAIFESGSVIGSDITTTIGKLETEENSNQMKKENIDSNDENSDKSMSLALSNALVEYEENVEKSKSVHAQENTEELLTTLLPKMSLDHIQINYELEVYIVNVCEYKKSLEFFICQIEDYKILFELSRYESFNQIPHSALPTNDIFGLLEKKDDSVRDYIWRAVKVPCQQGINKNKETVYLIDFGESIVLTDKCIAFVSPEHYKKIPPLAIKCKLEGIENTWVKDIEKNQSYCEQFLQKHEFEKVTIRVIQKKKNILHVIILDFSRDFLDTETTHICKPNNPFIDDVPTKDGEQLARSTSMEFLSKPSLNISANIGDTIQIMVTHVISPISFYAIIQSDSTNSSGVFSWHEHQICSSQKTFHPPKVNDIVLSQYHKDDYYYRAKIIDANEKQDRYQVFYVDFGNTEIVPLRNLAECSKEQLEDPLRAVLFHLHNLSLQTLYDEAHASKTSYMNIRLKNALENVVVMILDQILNVKVIEKHNDELFITLLDEQYDSIPNMLQNMGVIK